MWDSAAVGAMDGLRRLVHGGEGLPGGTGFAGDAGADAKAKE